MVLVYWIEKEKGNKKNKNKKYIRILVINRRIKNKKQNEKVYISLR